MSVPWKDGIKGIAKQTYFYRYFKLLNPPKDPTLLDYYYQTIGFIDKEINSIVKIINKDIDIKTRIQEFEERFKEEREASLKKEAALYKQLTKKKYPDKEEERIQEWTRFFKGTDEKNIKKWSDKYCFFTLISSKEFYDAVKATEKEIFTRSLLLSMSQKKLGTSIDKKMILQIDQEFKNALYKNKKLDDFTKILIEEAFNTIATKTFGSNIFNKTKKKGTQGRNSIEAVTFSKNLRDEIRYSFEKNNIKIPNGKIELTNDNNKVFLRVVADELRENAFSKNQVRETILQQLDSSDEKIRQEGLDAIIKAIKDSLMIGVQKIKNTPSLNLMISKEKLDLSGNPRKEQFFKHVEHYINNKNGLEKFIRSQQEKTIKYTFVAIKSNEFVSGLLGELSSALTFQKDKMSVEMTGGAFGEIQGSNFGASVNDLTISKGSKTFGINVKHYVTSEDTIALYNSQKHSLDLNSDYLKKYYKDEEIQIMRWAVENQSFIQDHSYQQKNFAKNVAYHYSWEEIPAFLRIQDKTENTVTNLFFQLNNRIYPTSYIYTKIIENLKTLILKQGGKDKAFFSISYSSLQKPDNLLYKDRDEALNNYEDTSSYNNIHRISSTQRGTLKIKTNGLKINLLKFHLFKK